MYGHARRAELEHAGRHHHADASGRIRDAPLENLGTDLDGTGHLEHASHALHADDRYCQQHRATADDADRMPGGGRSVGGHRHGRRNDLIATHVHIDRHIVHCASWREHDRDDVLHAKQRVCEQRIDQRPLERAEPVVNNGRNGPHTRSGSWGRSRWRREHE